MKDNMLEVGDILYDRERFSSGLIKCTVERLTPKQAVLKGGSKVKIELTESYYGELHASKIGDYGHMEFGTPELNQEYKDQTIRRNLKRRLSEINVKDLPIEICEQIWKLLPKKSEGI